MTTACLIIIGNEILSGRTQDKNIAWIAKELNEIGVRLMEVRVVADIDADIIKCVNECRKAYTYIFTTGGIGPTHDDITSAAIARAFGVKLVRHAKTEAMFLNHYGREKLNAARLKMADLPKGALPIPNPVSVAPGFQIENVYVMAGVPDIMQAMFAHIKSQLKGGASMQSKTISAYVTEGNLAAALSAIQDNHPHVEIGSYPFVRADRLGTSLVTRATDLKKLDAAYAEVKAMLIGMTKEVMEEE